MRRSTIRTVTAPTIVQRTLSYGRAVTAEANVTSIVRPVLVSIMEVLMPTKEELEKEIHGLKSKLGKAEARIEELESAQPAAATGDPERVFGPDAVPLEQR